LELEQKADEEEENEADLEDTVMAEDPSTTTRQAKPVDALTDCLFCNHKAETFEDNMTHMTNVHSLFIPDIEYLVDLRGMIRYLGEKITVGNVCIFCNGKGRGMKSVDAVRKHMVSA